MPSAPFPAPAPVVIAIDPHKASWTAVAVDNRLQPLAVIRVEVNRDGYRQLRRFASRWSHAVWAIEGATGLGTALTARLTADRIDVVDVPAKLARRVRLLSTGHGRKTDQADALSVGIAAHTATRLTTTTTAVVDETLAALRALTEHRDDLVRARTQTINRLHALLAQLTPAGLPRGLTTDTPPPRCAASAPPCWPAPCARSPLTCSARSAASIGASPRRQRRCPPRSRRPAPP